MKPHLRRHHDWWFCRVNDRTYPGSRTPEGAFQNYYLICYGLLGP